MTDRRIITGRAGEKEASRFLEKNGYTVLEKNYRRKFGEIDIIARKDDYLVFIEVKTRTGHSHGDPLEAVTDRKQRQISRVAQCYLSEKRLHDTAARFDVIAVNMTKNSTPEIELIVNAFDLC
ncbi:YraN family protein [Desulfomarina sp.]